MKLLIANWKNYIHSEIEAKKLFDFYKILAPKKKAHLIVAPGVLHAPLLLKSYRGKMIKFANQDLDYCASDSSTGAVCAHQAKELGFEFALVGHSETRQAGKSNKDIKDAFYQALNNKLHPILIVGENERKKDASHFRFVKEQLRSTLKYFPEKKPASFILAYEPVWAIGGKKTPTQSDIEKMFIFLRKELVKYFGEKKAFKIPIVYGGSVNSHNIDSILDTQVVDGVLLGRASVDIEELSMIYAKLGR